MRAPARDVDENVELGSGLALIADDLTGALDSAGCFAANGTKTQLILKPDWTPQATVIACSTNSREDRPEEAAEKVKRAVVQFAGFTLFKKIDSTLRGNIVTELASALDASSCHRALIAPALPVYGRITLGSVQYIGGTEVSEIKLAGKTVYDVQTSHLLTLLGDAKLPIRSFGLDWMEGSAINLANEIKRAQEPLLVFDASTESHLATLAKAARRLDTPALLCGSAGFAFAIANNWDLPKVIGQPSFGTKRFLKPPVLVVVGSCNPVTRQQVSSLLSAARDTVVQVAVRPCNLLYRDTNPICNEIGRLLIDGIHTVLSIAETTPEQTESSPAIANALGEVVGRVVEQVRPGALVLTGGDTAWAICDQLGLVGLEIVAELFRGIPISIGVGGLAGGLPLVTKAGGFGKPDLITQIIQLASGDKLQTERSA